MIMIDTDILIWIFRKKPEIKAEFDKLVRDVQGYVYVTPIQVAEIYARIRKSERAETAAFFQAVHYLEITEAIGQQAGEFMNQYQKSHNVILADSLIAAASLQHRFKLWTLNRKHYPMMLPENFYK